MDDVDYEGEEFEKFYGKIHDLVDGLDLPQKVFEASCKVCDGIREVEGFRHSFASFGGFDAVVAVSVFLGARQEGVPVLAEQVYSFGVDCGFLGFTSAFGKGKLLKLAGRFRDELGLQPVFLDASDYVKFYSDRFSYPVLQEGLEDELFVSQVAVRNAYKEVVEGLTGVSTLGRELDNVEVTAESFGFFGEGVEGFALYLLEQVYDEGLGVEGRSPAVLAASVLYIAGRLV